MPLDEIVSVNISLQTSAIEQAGFGVPLLVTEHTDFTARTKSYASLTEVGGDFETNSNAYLMAQAVFGQELKPQTIKIGRKAAGESYAEAINAIIAEDEAWYALAIESSVAADVLAVAAIIEANRKIFAAASTDVSAFNALETGDIGSQLQALSYFRTFTNARNSGEFPEVALLGRQLPTAPGSSTWMFKTITGVTVTKNGDGDPLTSAQSRAARDKNINVYESIAGQNITREGVMAGGEFIDVIRGRDWLQARIQEALYFQLVNSPKVPYTNAGMAVIENALREQLDRAADAGVIDPSTVVINVPKISETSANDRANRIARNITFSARLQGAIHEINIEGTLTV